MLPWPCAVINPAASFCTDRSPALPIWPAPEIMLALFSSTSPLPVAVIVAPFRASVPVPSSSSVKAVLVAPVEGESVSAVPSVIVPAFVDRGGMTVAALTGNAVKRQRVAIVDIEDAGAAAAVAGDDTVDRVAINRDRAADLEGATVIDGSVPRSRYHWWRIRIAVDAVEIVPPVALPPEFSVSV